MLEKTLDSTKINFFEYLTNLGLSSKSHKNYRSDLGHFSGWLIFKIRSFGSYIESLTEALPFLSKDIANEYRSYMIANKIPAKTINRRLSTLRHLSRFLVKTDAVSLDFMNGIGNLALHQKRTVSVNPIIEEYQGYLEANKISKNTIKNYTSDVRQFFAWVEANRESMIRNSQF